MSKERILMAGNVVLIAIYIAYVVIVLSVADLPVALVSSASFGYYLLVIMSLALPPLPKIGTTFVWGSIIVIGTTLIGTIPSFIVAAAYTFWIGRRHKGVAA